MTLDERRRHERYVVWRRVMLIPFKDGHPLTPLGGTLVDVSETGALVELGYPVQPGQVVAMFIESGSAKSALRAVVLSCRDATGYMAHLRFTAEQAQEARDVLARCIDEARQDRKGLFNRATRQRPA